MLLAMLVLCAASCGREDSVVAPPDPANDESPPGRPAAPGKPAVNAVVSNPIAPTSATATGPTASTEPGMVYVSLPPGTVPQGSTATIRNPRTGLAVTTTLTGGGFDPVAIAAQVDDTLQVQVREVGGTLSAESNLIVPRRRRPVVIRTDPPPKKRDVPLNASVVIVFSEPVDPATVNPLSVRLGQDGVTVPATVRQLGNGSMVELTPTAALESNATYELAVLNSISDLDGDALEATVTVTFTTQIHLDGLIAFSSTRDGTAHIWVVRPDGSGLTRLTDGPAADESPAWSWDGQRIAFARARSIWVMNADGSDPTQLTTGADDDRPAWSPDGTRIAFSRSTAPFSRQIYLMNADGSGVTRLIDGMYDDTPSWSPDGQQIAFERTVELIGDWFTQVYLMNADGSGVSRLTSAATPNQSAEGGPRWAPDGSAIALWSFFSGLAIAASGGGTPATMYFCFPYFQPEGSCEPQTAFDARPDWSPDGSALVFTGHGPVGTSLFLIDRATRGLRPLLPTPPGGSDLQPSWSRVRE